MAFVSHRKRSIKAEKNERAFHRKRNKALSWIRLQPLFLFFPFAQDNTILVRSISSDKKVFERRRYWHFFLLIFTFSLALRVFKIIVDPVMARDSALYILLASNDINQGEYMRLLIDSINVPPLPVFFIKIVMESGYSAEVAGRSVSLFLGSVLPFLGFLFAHKLLKCTGKAFICALILALHPNLITYSTQPLRENFYLFFLGLALFELFSGIVSKKAINWISCGALTALSFFSRYEALEFIIIAPAITIYLIYKDKKIKKHLGNLLLFFFSFIMICFALIVFFEEGGFFLYRLPSFLYSFLELQAC